MVKGRTVLKEGHAGRWLGRALSGQAPKRQSGTGFRVCNLLKDALRKSR